MKKIDFIKKYNGGKEVEPSSVVSVTKSIRGIITLNAKCRLSFNLRINTQPLKPNKLLLDSLLEVMATNDISTIIEYLKYSNINIKQYHNGSVDSIAYSVYANQVLDDGHTLFNGMRIGMMYFDNNVIGLIKELDVTPDIIPYVFNTARIESNYNNIAIAITTTNGDYIDRYTDNKDITFTNLGKK